jgi:hypothetical protein
VALRGSLLAELRPTILALNAGAPPKMASLDEQLWETFSDTWNTDVKAGLGIDTLTSSGRNLYDIW